jgi:hypothetical protein
MMRMQLVQVSDGHPNQITACKAQLLEGAAGVFGAKATSVPRRWISKCPTRTVFAGT